MEFRIGFDLSLIILSAVIFAANLKTLKRNRARLGRVQASWRLGFNFALPGSRLRAVLLLVPAAAGAVWLNSQPGSVKWLDALSFVCLGLAFYPRYNFAAVGREGVLDRWVVIPWESVGEKRVVEEGGRRHLELRLKPEPVGRAEAKVVRIRVPSDVSLTLD